MQKCLHLNTNGVRFVNVLSSNLFGLCFVMTIGCLHLFVYSNSFDLDSICTNYASSISITNLPTSSRPSIVSVVDKSVSRITKKICIFEDVPLNDKDISIRQIA